MFFVLIFVFVSYLRHDIVIGSRLHFLSKISLVLGGLLNSPSEELQKKKKRCASTAVILYHVSTVNGFIVNRGTLASVLCALLCPAHRSDEKTS